MRLGLASISVLTIAIAAAASSACAQSGEGNVYSYRETKLIQPLFDEFTKDTGIKVNLISANSVGGAGEGGAEGLPRPRRRLVRHLDAGARGLCLEGARQAGRHHLRGT